MSAPVSYMIPPVKAPKKTSEEVHTGFARASIPPMPSPKPPSPEEDDLGPATTVIQHAFSIDVKDNFQNSGTAHIHLWCLNRDSNPVLIRMPEFPVFCYAQLPAFVDGTPMHWDASNAVHVIRYLKFALKDDAPTKAGLESKTLLHYFRGEAKTPMLILVFPTIKAMQHCQNLMNTPKQIRGVGLMKLEMWETSISIVRKMFTLRKCRFSQWFEIRGRQVPFESERRVSKQGTPEHPIEEYLCSWDTLIPIPPEVSKSWMTQPRMLAIDIETYSDNHHAMPDEHNTLHVAYMISCVYQQLGKTETRHATLIVMGPCDPIPGSDVISCTSEHEMIIEMGKLIDRVDPDIITGYNIFSYDYPYLHARLSVKMLDWPQMSRLQGVTPQMTSKSWKSGAYGHNRINNLVMDGRISIDMLPIIRRDYKLDKYDLDFVSRFFIKKSKHDVKAARMFEIYEELQAATTGLAIAQDIPVTRSQAEIEIAALREALGLPEPPKLDVATQVRVSLETAQARYVAATAEMRRVGEYCLQDSALVIDLFEKLNVWIGLIELSSIVGVTIVELFTRGQQVRTLSQLYDLASSLGYVIDKRSAPKMFYNGGFVFDPKPGLYDNIICIDFASLYPSIMMAYNVCYTTLVPREFDREIPDEQCNVNEFDQEEPIDGRPSRRNHVNDEGEGVVEGVNDDPEAVDSDEDDEPPKKTVTRHYRFRFVKREVRDGILPQLVRRLVDERNAVRAYMKILEAQKKAFNTAIGILRAGAIPEVRDFTGELTLESLKSAVDDVELQLTVLDKRQNALKVSANSMYGFLGAQDGGFLPLIEGAMSVTAWGRSLISQVNKYIETKYGGTIVYGDTDSSMADLHITDATQVNPMGHRLAAEISGTPEKRLDDGTIIPAVAGLFPPPLRVEFEKGQRLLCIKKKKYAYLLIRDDGSFAKDRDTGEVVIFKKGIAIARRDTCQYFRQIYTNLLRGILTGMPIVEGFGIIAEACARLLNHEIKPKGQLTIIRELGANYKQDSYFLKVFADELRRMGKPANPGDRLEYVVVRTREEQAGLEIPLGRKMRSIEMWEESQEVFGSGPPPLPMPGEKGIDTTMMYVAEDIDAVYYIGHVFQNAIDQLFGVGYMGQLERLKTIGYTPQHSRRKFTSVETPIGMIMKFIDDTLRSFAHFTNPEREKLAHIAQTVRAMPTWFADQIEITSRSPVEA